MKIKIATAVCGAALLLQVSGAAAQLAPRLADELTGSDTFDGIMKQLIQFHFVTAGNGAAGIGVTAASYIGHGSGAGQRQMEGASNASERNCGFGAPATHPGCQEISPMSSRMTSGVCNDAESTGAEGIVVCDDGLAVFTDNASMKGRPGIANACTTWRASSFAESVNSNGDDFSNIVGQLGHGGGFIVPGTTYEIGANGVAPWKDVLRVIYTGCKNDGGDCVLGGAGGTTNPIIPRLTRCGDTVRSQLINSWNAIQDGVDCATSPAVTCAGGLRRAYRRDDSSGTTTAFLGFLSVGSNVTGRPKVFSSALDCTNADQNRCCDDDSRRIWKIPTTHSYCDGGQNENFMPDCRGGQFFQVGGDPVRKPCVAEDDMCDLLGQGGVVQAIVSTPSEQTDAFATHQCGQNAYANNQYVIPVPLMSICPDGTTPVGGLCNMPEFQVGGVLNSRNCMANATSRSASAGGTVDGRAYNALRRRFNGSVWEIQYSTAGATPVVPSWRMNQYRAVVSAIDPLRTPGFDIAAQNRKECQLDSATRQIGCIVGKTTCSIGFAGREAVFAPADATVSLGTEPFTLQNLVNSANYFPPKNVNIGPLQTVPLDQAYPLQRPLFINSIGGFETMTARCTARIPSPPRLASDPLTDAAWCTDQELIAQAFYDVDGDGPGGIVDTAAYLSCLDEGFLPRNAATRSCESGRATGGPGCGPTDPNVGTDDDADGTVDEAGEQPYTACLPN